MTTATALQAAKQTGATYTSIQAAIDTISDAGPDKHYVVLVAPGVYNESIKIPPNVSLVGAGRGQTVIETQGSSTNNSLRAAVLLQDHASMRQVLVRTRSGTYAYGITVSGRNATLHEVDVVVDQAAIAYGIFSDGNDERLTNVTVSVEGRTEIYGLVLRHTTGSVRTIRIRTSGGHSTNAALYVDEGDLHLEDASLTALGKNGTGTISELRP